ncbi:unnamed protein product [Musa textilis]
MFEAKKTTKGKQRIEMKKIENMDARYISFSKRRNGVFVKASELSTLCSADLAANSTPCPVQRRRGGKLHSIGSRSVDLVVNRFLSSGSKLEQSCRRHAVQHRNRQLVELTHLVEAGKARKAELGGRLQAAVRGQGCKWLDDIDALGLDELDGLRESMG